MVEMKAPQSRPCGCKIFTKHVFRRKRDLGIIFALPVLLELLMLIPAKDSKGVYCINPGVRIHQL
jgi:hypothetical protein